MEFINSILTQIPDLITQFGSNVLGAIAIFFIGYQVAKFLRRLAQNALGRANFDPTLGRFVINLVYYAILVFVVMASLDQLGVDTNSFIAVLGAAGLAAGLAMEGALANFTAGVILILTR
ncbi:MAG: mechanosensitive ion channel family protein, partial [Chloroflexota bacterium]